MRRELFGLHPTFIFPLSSRSDGSDCPGPRSLQASVVLEDVGWCDSLHGQELDPMASHGSLGTTTKL